MPFIGTPLDTRNTFQSLQGKRFNGDGSTTAFTLDIAPSSVFDIEVFVENVRQDPNSAYGISGTTLTFTGAPPSGTNNIYVVHQAKAVGTIDVPASGVVPASLASNILTGQTDIGAAIADADLLLVDDGAGGTLRKTAASRLKTYIGDNTPAFGATIGSEMSLSQNTWSTVAADTEIFDSDSCYNTSNYTFTPNVAGKYFVFAQIRMADNSAGTYAYVQLYKNGDTSEAQLEHYIANHGSSANNTELTLNCYKIIDFNGSSDNVVVRAQVSSTGVEVKAGTAASNIGAYRLVGT